MYCTGCGQKLASDSDAFCTGCGKPVEGAQGVPNNHPPEQRNTVAAVPAEPAPPAATQYSPPIAPAQQVDSGAAKPKKKGRAALLIVLLILIVAICIGAAWYFIIYRDRDGDAARRDDSRDEIESSEPSDRGGESSEPKNSGKNNSQTKPGKETPEPSPSSDAAVVSTPAAPAELPSPALPAEPETKPPVVEVIYPAPFFDMVSASGYTGATSSGSYEPELVLDYRTDTAWNVPAAQDVWIMLSSDTEQYVSGLSILNGFTKYNEQNGWVYYGNHRPKDIIISFSDGSAVFWTLEDVFDEDNYIYQDIPLDSPVLTTYVKITITSVYQGSRWNDICISEIEVY